MIWRLRLSSSDTNSGIAELMIPLGNADEKTYFETWTKYLEEKFTFPFTAIVKEFQDRGPLRHPRRYKNSNVAERS